MIQSMREPPRVHATRARRACTPSTRVRPLALNLRRCRRDFNPGPRETGLAVLAAMRSSNACRFSISVLSCRPGPAADQPADCAPRPLPRAAALCCWRAAGQLEGQTLPRSPQPRGHTTVRLGRAGQPRRCCCSAPAWGRYRQPRAVTSHPTLPKRLPLLHGALWIIDPSWILNPTLGP